MTIQSWKFSTLISILFLIFIPFGLFSISHAQIKLNSETIITIEVAPGWVGPYYLGEIHDDGTVIYNGKTGVLVKGKRCYKIPTEKVAELVEEFQRINYFSLQDKYESNVTDTGHVITSISIDGKYKKIINESGSSELGKLEGKIIEIAGFAKYSVPDNIKFRIDSLFIALQAAPTAKGFIINYGTKRNIAKREADIRSAIKFRAFDINRVEFIRHIRSKGIKTEFRTVNEQKITNY